ncbi:MAG: oligopeptide-binding protein oppA [Chlamydiota bacterium]|jgi:oligopeptide transport system substrate-binding protein
MRVFVCAIFLCFLCSCQPSTPSSNSTVRINIKDEPQTLDPRKARRLNDQTVVHMLFDGLLRVGKNKKAELAVAKSVEISEDLKTYTFELKETYWSNLDRVTAHDFVYAWKKILSPEFPCDLSSALYGIKNAKKVKEGLVSLSELGVVALDEKTLLVELERPDPNFLEQVALSSFSPINAKVDQENPTWMFEAESYVSNGPFILTSWEHQRELQLKKNPLYWESSSVHLEKVVLEMVEEETELKLFEKKELDWAGSPLSTIPVDAIASLKREGLLQKEEGLGTYFLRINTHHPILSNQKIRQALGHAINRTALVEHVLKGGQTIALSLLPPFLESSQAPLFQDADVQGAVVLFNEALKDLGLNREEFPQICYLYRRTDLNHLMAQAIQEEWRSLFGITVVLEAVEGKVFFDRVSKTDYDISYGNWIADFSDPFDFLSIFKQPLGSNNTHWTDLQYNALLDQACLEKESQKRKETLFAAEKILIDQMPIIPLYYWNLLYLSQPHLKEVVISPLGQLDLKWAFIEETR